MAKTTVEHSDNPKPSLKKVASTVAPLTLPNNRSTPKEAMADYLVLMHGEKKVGKTSMMAEIEDALFLFCEPGGKGLSVFGIPITGWEQLKQVPKLLRAEPKKFSTVVVDTADQALVMCERHVKKQFDVDDLTDVEWGKGWRAFRTEWAGWVTEMGSLGRGLVFISHTSDKELTTRTGKKYQRLGPTLVKAGAEFLEGVVDILVYYGYEGNTRVLVLQGDDHIAAGHRLKDRFKFKGVPLPMIDMGSNEAEALANFQAAFNNQYSPPQWIREKMDLPSLTVPATLTLKKKKA